MTQNNVTSSPDSPAGNSALVGALAAGFGYLWWGFSVVYYKATMIYPIWEVLAHRPIWTVSLTFAVVLLMGRLSILWSVLTNRKLMGRLFITSMIIGSNWLVFNFAIYESRVMETSLGYYINPLISVVLGVVLLSERLSRPQIAAVFLAALGVLALTIHQGSLPWISLYMAGSFAAYGYLRKVMSVGPLEGLVVEALYLCPMAICYLFYAGAQGDLVFGHEGQSIGAMLLLVAIGPMTAIPLFAFTFGAQRIRLSTMGLMQYIAPTTHFFLAIHYGEAFGTPHMIAFGLIWTALVIFSIDLFRQERRIRKSAGLA
ncbi:MAG: EamA family transporter RarD [Parvibaculaceae bacterium]|nr:EamA family transporter RarD [Parvibaculaceae bacterium]